MKPIKIVFSLFFILTAISCWKKEIKPVEIIPSEDMCSYCRMAISDNRFAAECLTPGGEVYKFDDIGCMFRFRETEKSSGTWTTFLVDYDTKEWLKAEEAWIARSENISTPMGGGMAAFKNKEQADTFAKEKQGEVLSYQELIKGK